MPVTTADYDYCHAFYQLYGFIVVFQIVQHITSHDSVETGTTADQLFSFQFGKQFPLSFVLGYNYAEN